MTNERDEAHAEAYRHLQARELIAAYERGIAPQLLSVLNAWREDFPTVFTDEVEALRVKLQAARRGMEELQKKHTKKRRGRAKP